MEPRLDYIRQLVRERDWNGSDFAREMGISRAEANRLLNGKRKGGKKLIAGLLKAFPSEDLATLFFLPSVYPKSTIANENATKKPCVDVRGKPSQTVAVKHPKAHQLACTMNEAEGRVEIISGSCVTTLLVPPGFIEVRHTTQQA